MEPLSPIGIAISRLLTDLGAVSVRDLRSRLSSIAGDVNDGDWKNALKELEETGLIKINSEQFGRTTDEIIRLTHKGVRQSS